MAQKSETPRTDEPMTNADWLRAIAAWCPDHAHHLTEAADELDDLTTAKQEVIAMRERCAKAVPTGWLDPLLTGADAALPKNMRIRPTPDIENLLRGIRDRILALPAAEPLPTASQSNEQDQPQQEREGR